MIYFLIIFLGVIFIWFVATYNFFVSTKARIKASIQEIGNQLKRQADLIPNLETSAKAYLSHEKEVFKTLADARKAVESAVNSGDVQKMVDAGSKLADVLPQIRAVLESNPEIKGSEVISKLMDELRDTADKVMYTRRLFIDLTADFNVKRVSFPSNLVASIFGFKEQSGLTTPTEGKHLEVSSDDLKTPKVNL